MSDPRKIAAQLLQKVLTKRAFFSEIKSTADSLEGKDLAFVNMLVLSSLRHLVFIKKVLHQYAKKRLPDKVAFAEYALLLGLTEILYMDTPDYAVINSYVEIVKKETDKYVSGFVNAVLRKVCADREELIKRDTGEFFTSEFFRILNATYGKKTVSKIQKASVLEPSLDLTVKSDPEIWAQKLNGTLLSNGSIRISDKGRITYIEGFNEGAWWVQDVAASLPVMTLGDIKGLRVLDMCAAPGGKTAQLANGGAVVTSLDISETRLKKLRDNLARLQLELSETICADGLDYLNNFRGEKFDAIILDAPCSATGTIRRHPELVHIKSLQDVEKQARLQQEFLNSAANALRRDGYLIYCVCSMSKIEGENQIRTFLEKHKHFKLIPITEADINKFNRQSFADLITEEGFIRTLPYHLQELGGMDSFFIAKLQKVA